MSFDQTKQVSLHNFNLSKDDFIESLLDALYNEDIVFEYPKRKQGYYFAHS